MNPLSEAVIDVCKPAKMVRLDASILNVPHMH